MARVYDIKDQKFLDDMQDGLCMGGFGEGEYVVKVGRYRFFLTEEEASNLIDTWSTRLQRVRAR